MIDEEIKNRLEKLAEEYENLGKQSVWKWIFNPNLKRRKLMADLEYELLKIKLVKAK